MPFGITSAPEEFEARLQEKLSGINRVEVLCDDILVVGYGDTQEESEANHDENSKKATRQIKNGKLKAKQQEYQPSSI